VGWYLMSPPMRCERWTLWGNGCIDAHPDTSIDIEAPLAKWHLVSPFEHLAECQAELSREIETTHLGAKFTEDELQASISATQSQCIATDDPRLAK
jgi:hypothetical protein